MAALSRSDPQPVTTAKEAVVAAAPGLDATALRDGTDVESTWAAGSDVTVTASYPYTISIFGLDVYSGNLTSTTTGRVE